MTFLIVSQRAIANNKYSLKNLEGHGRIDIIFRTILASTRPLTQDQGQTIYCYLKGSLPHGWLKIDPEFIDENDDEVSLAGRIRKSWNELFIEGSLVQLKEELPKPILLLHEEGQDLKIKEGTIVLGAQRDLVDQDLQVLNPEFMVSLGERSLLASHAIIYTRQLIEQL